MNRVKGLSEQKKTDGTQDITQCETAEVKFQKYSVSKLLHGLFRRCHNTIKSDSY